jgi:hypothetical protein
MDEKNLIKFWHEQRSQVIHAQLAPSIVLIGILALALKSSTSAGLSV